MSVLALRQAAIWLPWTADDAGRNAPGALGSRRRRWLWTGATRVSSQHRSREHRDNPDRAHDPLLEQECRVGRGVQF